VTVTAADGRGGTDSETFSWTIAGANVGPVVTNPGSQSVAEGSLLTLALQATDPDAGQVLTYSLDAGPAGTAIDPATGVLTWTPTDGPTTVTMTVRVTDNGTPVLFSAATFSVTVTNVSPTLQISGAATAVPGQPYTLTLSAVDPGVDTISQWTIDWGDSTQVVTGSPASVQHLSRTRLQASRIPAPRKPP